MATVLALPRKQRPESQSLRANSRADGEQDDRIEDGVSCSLLITPTDRERCSAPRCAARGSPR